LAAGDYGILIERVLPGGAAEKAGMRGGTQRLYQGNEPVMLGGDLIVGFDGKEIRRRRICIGWKEASGMHSDGRLRGPSTSFVARCRAKLRSG
jgi:hypothetical protein